MVKPRGKIVRDLEITARDLSFKSVWRELREQGRTRKPPPRRGLDNRYFSLRRDGDASGADSVDILCGEEAVLVYYANDCRSKRPCCRYCHDGHFAARSTPPVISVAAVAREAPVAAIDHAAQPTATATRDAPLTPPSTYPPVRHQAPGKRPARRSARRSLEEATWSTAPRTPPRTPQVQIATSPHVTPGDSADNEDDHDSSADSALSNGAPSDVESGVIDSGDETEKDDVETGEYDSDEDMKSHCPPNDYHDDPEETEQEITADVLFAENVLGQFGGEDEVLAGNFKNQALHTAEYLMTPYEPVNDSGSYPSIRRGYSVPTADVFTPV
ncbi:hypothetical protein PHYSODRAFT_261573 [Phytophthora sojae]|uniref:Uncharacterized protein n=1 Tax=Phytophthora sojae (strain P6497) TaxID=1094619 RepID=G4YEN4_PHYSP|nr:hypothetical protein PHYSODRAFT_261573 [Phytophthora sojae]EGZ27575.1 hypothetical protein PHYSODRAFT_261573 [Phytophthora sojae]|eukprot:XP_009514850.1 hypothetical protein PHYSODRAFT_261573 [Phytophthora sojae]